MTKAERIVALILAACLAISWFEAGKHAGRDEAAQTERTREASKYGIGGSIAFVDCDGTYQIAAPAFGPVAIVADHGCARLIRTPITSRAGVLAAGSASSVSLPDQPAASRCMATPRANGSDTVPISIVETSADTTSVTFACYDQAGSAVSCGEIDYVCMAPKGDP